VSANKYLPHVYVLPEDDANRELANGFHLEIALDRQRQMQVLLEASGWNEVLNLFTSEHVAQMDRWPNRYMVLLFDFDGHPDRLQTAQESIPDRLHDRVFILGALTEPEELKAAGLGNYESIGAALAADCRDGTETAWEHPLLQHNANEVHRLSENVRSILF